MVGQCRIDERFLPIEGFRGAAARKTISVQFTLDDFREEFRDRTQPEPVSPVPSIQRLSKHKLAAIGVVAQVQPIIHFAPILGALCDCRARLPRIDTPDDDIDAIQPSFGVEALRNPCQSSPQNRFNRLARTTDL